MEKGDSCSTSQITLGSHSGTHVDAPGHYIKGAATVDQLAGVLLGRARVIEIGDRECIRLEELRRHQLRRGERILFKTSNSALWSQSSAFYENYVYITAEAAQYIVDKGVAVIGVDYLSVGGYYHDGCEVHRILLNAGIWIIEGLDLSAVGAGSYDLACLPLKIYKGDGAPARAVIRRRPEPWKSKTLPTFDKTD
ncbi:metal-dependent hydrolase [Dehalogenimonas sp. WBC-2]|nr:metal-dependent hydrolase [Dehalogenimonas sp. WBC-2]